MNTTRARPYDIPLTREESISAEKKFSIFGNCGEYFIFNYNVVPEMLYLVLIILIMFVC